MRNGLSSPLPGTSNSIVRPNSRESGDTVRATNARLKSRSVAVVIRSGVPAANGTSSPTPRRRKNVNFFPLSGTDYQQVMVMRAARFAWMR